MIEIAEITAVSDLKIFSLILRDWTPLKERISSLSVSEKSPSGPTIMQTGLSVNFDGVQALKINDNILRSETAVISTISIVNYAINW